MTQIIEKSKADLDSKTRQAIMRDEMVHLEDLVSRRRDWLDLPLNKKRSTYQAVLRDTREMEKTLEDLKKELDYQEDNDIQKML